MSVKMFQCACRAGNLANKTVFTQAVRSASIFSRFRKTHDEQEPPVVPASEEKRKYIPGEDGSLLKEELHKLSSKSKGLTNRRAYKPPQDVEERIERVAAPHCREGADWRGVQLTDPKLKYKVLTEFDHDIPNTTLHEMKTLQDAVEFFNTEVKITSALDDLSSTCDLPPNLSIQTEYTRFDPNNADDPLTRGRTAFPGSDTRMTSIKYKRKYKDIITTKPRPGSSRSLAIESFSIDELVRSQSRHAA